MVRKLSHFLEIRKSWKKGWLGLRWGSRGSGGWGFCGGWEGWSSAVKKCGGMKMRKGKRLFVFCLEVVKSCVFCAERV